MTATYDDTLKTELDRARSRIGDTDVEHALHSDEHINAVLGYAGTLDAAVTYLASELVAMFGRSPIRKSASGVSVDYSENLKLWRQLAGEAAAASSGGSITFVDANYTGDADVDEWARAPWWWRP